MTLLWAVVWHVLVGLVEANDARRWRMRVRALDSSTRKASGLKEDTLDPGTKSYSNSAVEVAGTVTSLLAKEVIPGITVLGLPTTLAVTSVQGCSCSSGLGAWTPQLSQYPKGRIRKGSSWVKKEAWAGRGASRASTGIIFAALC